MRVAVIGGGAAGFFAAVNVKDNYPTAEVTLLEKTTKLLAKVSVSGGGRCNVTNGTTSIKELCDGYPRGAKPLKKLFKIFKTTDTKEWFESRGVPLKTEDDNRVFPVSNNSQSIIDCLMQECQKLKIEIRTKANVTKLEPEGDKMVLHFQDESEKVFDKVIIASGGSPKRSGLEWLGELGHQIVDPVPSLFTFNMPSESIKELMGVVAENTIVTIEGSKLRSTGPILITHWGMSGPAILKLSSLGARELYEKKYKFTAQVNWVKENNQDHVKEELMAIISSHPKKLLQNIKPFNLPNRLWLFLLAKCEFSETKIWAELGKKGVNKMIKHLCNDTYQVNGKTTFKEEFVTCGGVSLDSIDMLTLQSKRCNNIYFAGEVIDIDGITGGYNFQAAWTTAFIASKLGVTKNP